MNIRIISVVCILLTSFLLPWWVTLLGVFIFTLRYNGLELIPLLILVDSYHGAFSRIPWLSGLAIVIIIGMMLVRPFIMLDKSLAPYDF